MRFLGGLAVMIATMRIASAECAMPAAEAPSERTVPRHATMFVYLDQDLYAGIGEVPVFETWARGEGTLVVSSLTTSISRIDVDGSDGAEVVLRGKHFHLTDSATVDEAPAITSLARSRGRWTCSSWDDLQVSLVHASSVAAIRADWTYQNERTTYWAVPRGDVSHDWDATFGKVSCGTATIPPKEMAAGGTLTLTAVMVDRSERVLAKNVEVSDRALPLSTPMTLAELTYTEDNRELPERDSAMIRAKRIVPSPRPSQIPWVAALALLGLAIVGLGATGIAIAATRRR